METPIINAREMVLGVRFILRRIEDQLAQIENELLAAPEADEPMDPSRYIKYSEMLHSGDQAGVMVTVAEAACDRWLSTTIRAFQ